jgi:endo-1,4-beta-xylanase
VTAHRTTEHGRSAPVNGKGVLLTAAALCTVILTVTGILVAVLPEPEQEGHLLPGLARAQGIDLGVAVAVDPLTHDRRYRGIVEDHYTSVTAENTMKWEHVQPERGEYDWSGPDAVVDFATARDLNVRGHTMLWHNQQPAWLSQGDWDAESLSGVVHEHVTTVMERYRGRISAWDIINEPLEDGGPDIRRNLWYEVLGPDYIAQTLYSAHAADPDAKRLVQTFEFDGAPGHVALESATFEDLGGRTRLVTHSVYQSVEDRDAMVESGMESGLTDSMNRLDEVLANAS